MDNEQIKKRAYEIFRAKCLKLVQSKFLLAQPCIAAVLKCIIASPELYGFFKDVIVNIDLEKELMKATVAGKLVLPESKRLKCALITYLLNQFDNNGLDLMKFISRYYDKDTNIGYQIFSSEVIMPYIDIVGDLFLNAAEEEESREEAVNSAVSDMADDILKNILTAINADNSLNEKQRKEMTAVTEGMMIALINLDRKVIIALWIAMKQILGRNRKINKLLKELEKLFIDYMIIDINNI
ncbi:MAG: hypothetical protein ACOX3U_04450 [Christensenellales bacterium]|jgi:hypothetical protein